MDEAAVSSLIVRMTNYFITLYMSPNAASPSFLPSMLHFCQEKSQVKKRSQVSTERVDVEEDTLQAPKQGTARAIMVFSFLSLPF